MASERTFTLLELNHMVRETIERQMDCKYWVEAEPVSYTHLTLPTRIKV